MFSPSFSARNIFCKSRFREEETIVDDKSGNIEENVYSNDELKRNILLKVFFILHSCFALGIIRTKTQFLLLNKTLFTVDCRWHRNRDTRVPMDGVPYGGWKTLLWRNTRCFWMGANGCPLYWFRKSKHYFTFTGKIILKNDQFRNLRYSFSINTCFWLEIVSNMRHIIS